MSKFFGQWGAAAVKCCLVASAVFWMLVGVANAAPTNTKAPTLSEAGQVLTFTQGTWTDATAVSISDVWEACTPTCTAMAPQPVGTYAVKAADLGHTIEVVETATATDGQTTIAPAVGPLTAVNVALPRIVAGTAQQGQTLTMTSGTWNPTGATITDQWEDCTGLSCTAIPGQTGATYTLGPGDVGHTIQVLETATYTGLTPLTAASTATAAVSGNSSAPTITGTGPPQEGQPLTLKKGTWVGILPALITDQWESCAGVACAPVGAPNSATYVPGPTDVGHMIEVVETVAGLPLLTTPSAQVGPVAPLAVPLNTRRPGISGIPQQGQTLTVSQGTWPSATSITDQWEDCTGLNCTATGQTGSTYTLGPGDVGHTIEVVETGANDGGPGIAAIAGPTATVTATSITSVEVVANAPTTNQTVTLVATVTSSSGNARPDGSMSFFDGPNGIQGCTGKGVKGGLTVTVVCQASFPAGTAVISAAYVPGSGSLVDGSTSAATAVFIGRDSTSVSLAVTKQVARGRRATYSATVALPASNSGPIALGGSIEFLDRGQPIPACLSQPLNNLTATCTVKYRKRGVHVISATYRGDSNFGGSTSPAQSVRVGKGSGAPAVLGFVKSTLQWTFYYHPTYTQLILFKAFQVDNGTSVLLTCGGNGCAFRRLQDVGTNGGSINLLPAFHQRRLKVGATITVRLTHAHWVGKYYSFTIRAGRPPLIDLSCLAVGRTAPGVGC